MTKEDLEASIWKLGGTPEYTYAFDLKAHTIQGLIETPIIMSDSRIHSSTQL